MMKIASIQVALPRTYGTEGAANPMERPWTSAFAKEPVAGPVRLGATNLAGDQQADPRYHGGPDKAVLCYAAAHYPQWREELGRELPHGGFGENFTVEGRDESTGSRGDVYAIGGARVEVSQPRLPCWKIARRWGMKDLSARVQRTRRTGWYLRVLEEGTVAVGDEIVLVDRPYGEWTIARANEALYTRPRAVDEIAGLAACPALAESLAAALRHFLGMQHDPDDDLRLVGPNVEGGVA